MDGHNRFVMLLVAVGLILGARHVLHKMYDKSIYRGPWYRVRVPEGWERQEKEDEVVFISPNRKVGSGLPEAVFRIYTKQTEGGIFLEDLFGMAVKGVRRYGGEVLQQGEIKIDGVKSRWLLARYKDDDLASLVFYIVDDFNRITKIEYSAALHSFKPYRKQFEDFKSSFKWKRFF